VPASTGGQGWRHTAGGAQLAEGKKESKKKKKKKK
jgi:hypothetical protein